MFVRDWMRKDVISITEADTILDAMHLMRDNNIRRLPVVQGEKLVGMITEKDIKEFSPSRASTLDIYEMHNILAKTIVRQAMVKNVITVNENDPIERAALILRDKRFGGIPVLSDAGKLVGIITAVDVFDVFVEAMGMNQPGARIDIFVEDQPGAIAHIARIIKEHSLNIISLATFFFKNKTEEGHRDVVVRVNGDDVQINKCVEALKAASFTITSVQNMDAIQNGE